MLKRLFLILAATSAVAMAGAQEFFHRPSPFAGRTLLTLALFDEVKTELKLTPDTNAKVDAEVAKMGDDIQGAFSSANGDFTAMRAEIDKLNAKHDEELLKLLSPEQSTRIKQLFVQYNGSSVMTFAWAAADLGLTDDQKAKVKKLQEDQGQKMMDAFQSGSQEDAQAAIKKIQDEFKADLAKVLTEDQTKKLKDMEGAKFEFKKE